MLSIYLNDHLAGATAALELVRRSAASNRDSGYGPTLEELAIELEQDRATLIELMDALEIGVDRLKLMGGWGAEKLGRLKLNGQLLGYSPLSRVLELETLALGVHGKLALWRALDALELPHHAAAAVDLATLEQRARDQLARLESLRRRATTEAFASPQPASA